jgi:hypothetical protein
VGKFTDINSNDHGFLYPKCTSTKNVSFIHLDVKGADATECKGINNNGEIVGGYTKNGNYFGLYRSSSGFFSKINVPGSTFTEANGINNKSEIVGNYEDNSMVGHSFLLASPSGIAKFLKFDPIGSTGDNGANGINDKDVIVGTGDSSSKEIGYQRSTSGFYAIVNPIFTTSKGNGINNNGQMVGSFTSAGHDHGFIAK